MEENNNNNQVPQGDQTPQTEQVPQAEPAPQTPPAKPVPPTPQGYNPTGAGTGYNGANAGQNYRVNPQPAYAYNTPQPPKKASGFAVASLVLGIIGVLSSCCCTFLSLPLGIIGTILGIVGCTKKNVSKGIAIAGIILSVISVLISVVCMLIIILSYGSLNYSDFYYDIENYLNTIQYSMI